MISLSIQSILGTTVIRTNKTIITVGPSESFVVTPGPSSGVITFNSWEWSWRPKGNRKTVLFQVHYSLLSSDREVETTEFRWCTKEIRCISQLIKGSVGRNTLTDFHIFGYKVLV